MDRVCDQTVMSTGVLPGFAISAFHRSLGWPKTALWNSRQ
jgi:hypothetical protein